MGLSRAEFSKEVGVSRAQLSMWEKGQENPTNQKLIVLGNLAHATLLPDPRPLISLERAGAISKLAEFPDSRWFWQRAGINLEAIEESIQQTRIERHPSAGGKVIEVPRLDAAALMQYVKRLGAVSPESLAADRIPFPALFISDPDSTICVQATDRVAGSPFRAGDLCLVRLSTAKRQEANAKDLPDRSFENLIDCSVAAFYKSVPNERELSPDAARWRSQNLRMIAPTVEIDFKVLKSQITPQEKKRAKRYLADASGPGVLLGTLRVQSHVGWNRDYGYLTKQGNPWRLVLDCGGTWNGLTDWSTDDFKWGALRVRLKEGISILGPVIGWLRASAGPASI